ncbi:MAG: SpaA isopeptide-forming pilin-related protein [Candidatus Limivicinus sp.]
MRALAWLLVLCMVLPMAQIDRVAYATDEEPIIEEHAGEEPGEEETVGEKPTEGEPAGGAPTDEEPAGEEVSGEEPGREESDGGEPGEVNPEQKRALLTLQRASAQTEDSVSTQVTVERTAETSLAFAWGDGVGTADNQHPGQLNLCVTTRPDGGETAVTIGGFEWNFNTQRYEHNLTAAELAALGLPQSEGSYDPIVITDTGDNSLNRSLTAAGLPAHVTITTTTTTTDEDGQQITTTGKEDKYITWGGIAIDGVTLPEGFSLAGVTISEYKKETTGQDGQELTFLRPYRRVAFNIETRFGSSGSEILENLLKGSEEDFAVLTLSTGMTVTKAQLAACGYDLSTALAARAAEAVPVYDDNMHEITYSLTTGMGGISYAEEDGRIVTCRIAYDNTGVPGFSDKMDRAYSGGSLILTRSGETGFSFTKEWLDEGNTGERPQASYTLWRYPQGVSNGYQSASQVKFSVQRDQGGTTVSSWDIPIEAADGETKIEESFQGLPRFDPMGNEYVYFIRETLPDNSGYEKVYGEVTQNGGSVTIRDTLPDGYGSDTRQAADTSVYNGGTISNRRISSVKLTATKNWEAACFQNQLENVSVQLALYAKPRTNVNGEEWYEVALDKALLTMADFSAIHTSASLELTLPKYDALGRVLDYALAEKSVTQITANGQITVENPDLNQGYSPYTYGQFAYQLPMNAEHLRQESIYHLDDPNAPDYREKDYFLSTRTTADTEEEDHLAFTFTNTLEGSTDYFLQKIWESSQADRVRDVTITVVQLDKSGRQTDSWDVPIKLEDYTEENGSYMSGWISLNQRMGVSLPRYDDSGAEYRYMAVEKAGGQSASYHSGFDFDKDGQSEANATRVVNGTGFRSIDVRKQWLDDGAYDERQPVYLNVFLTDGTPIYGTAEDGREGIISPAPVELTSNINWWRRIDASVFEKDNGDGTSTYLNRDDAAKADIKDNGHLYRGGFIVTEVRAGDVPINPSEHTGAGFTTYVSESGVCYAVVYSSREGEITLNGQPVNSQGAATPDTENYYTVTNLRIGTYNMEVTKLWQDDGYDLKYLERPQDAAITLSVEGRDDGFIGTDAAGSYVSVPAVVNGDCKQYIKNGSQEIITATQTLTGGSRENENTEVLYFLNLPLYDSYGKAISYALEESLPEGTCYRSKKGELTETRNNDDGSITAAQTFTNTPSDTKDVEFHMLWVDAENSQNGRRPDVFLLLYQTVYDAQGNPSIVRHDFVEYQWGEGATDDNDSWTYVFEGLPRFDAQGREIFYYATVNTHVDAAALDYQDVQYGEGQLTTLEVAQIINPLGAENGRYVVPEPAINEDSGAIVGMSGDVIVLKEDNTFVAQTQKEITIIGQKIWENLPVGYPVSQTPKLNFKLYRSEQMQNRETDAADPVATITGYQSPDVNYSFQIRWLGENYKDGAFETSGIPLPAYDNTGKRISYTLIETMTGGEDGMEISYTSLSGAVNGYKVTNTYRRTDNNARQLTVGKAWRAVINGNEQAPGNNFTLPTSVTFDLFRFYLEEDGSYSIPIRVASRTLSNYDEAADFGEQLIYDPSGKPFYYYLYEHKVEGYQCDFTLSGVKTESTPGLPSVAGLNFYSEAFTLLSDDGSYSENPSSATAQAANTFRGTPEFTATGTKQWMDYGNAFSTRPESLSLTVKRTAEGMADEDFAILTLTPDGIPHEVKVNQNITNYSGAVTVTTTAEGNAWNFQIGPLDGTASNGKRWSYTFTEAAPANYTADSASASVTLPLNAAENQTLPLNTVLKNSNLTTATVKKQWQDKNGNSLALVQMPDVTLGLQVSLDDGISWAWAAEYFSQDVRAQEGFPALTATFSKNQTGYTFKNLPAGYAKDGVYHNFRYRVVETKIGDQDVSFKADGVNYDDPASPAWSIVPTYGADKRSTTITNQIEVIHIAVSKSWENDSDNAYSTRGDVDGNSTTDWSVNYHLYRYTGTAPGKNNWEQVMNQGGSKPYVITVSGSNYEALKSATLSGLPAAAPNGLQYTYVAVELNPDGSPVTDKYNGAYDQRVAGNGTYDGKPYGTDFTNALETTSLAVTKNWAEDTQAMRPEKISLQLCRKVEGGSQAAVSYQGLDSTVLNRPDSGPWSITFDVLPKYDTAGRPYIYSVLELETPLPGYYAPIYSDVTDLNGDPITADSSAQQQTITNTATQIQLNKTGNGTDLNHVQLLYRSEKQTGGLYCWLLWSRDINGEEQYEAYRSSSGTWDGVSKDTLWTAENSSAGPVTVTGLPVGRYTLWAEPTLPAGYYGSAVGSHSFRLDNEKPVDVPSFTAANSQTVLRIRKVDDSDSTLTGWSFSVTGKFADGTTEQRLTDNSPSLTGLLIVDETYTLEEVTTPTGYVPYTGQVNFHVADDTSGTIVIETPESPASASGHTITFQNQPYQIPIRKTDRSGNALTGAQFAVYDGSYTPDAPGTPLIENVSTLIRCAGKLAVGGTYTLVETKAPAGYILPNAAFARFEVGDDGVVTSVTSYGLNASLDTDGVSIQVINDPIAITLTKMDGGYDGKGADAMPGVTFTLSDGTTEQHATTDEWGRLSFGPAGGNHSFAVVGDTQYTLKETTTGYEPFAATITIKTDGTLSVVQNNTKSTINVGESGTSAAVTNLRLKGSITLTKYGCMPDGSNPQPLSAAAFRLTWADQQAERKTENGLARWENLEWGTYTIEELSAPAGYIRYEGTITVTIGPNALHHNATSVSGLAVTNYKNQLSIFKMDADGKPLQATLALAKLDGSDWKDWKTDSTGQLYLTGLPAGDYKLTETVAPKGYRLPQTEDAALYFTMGEDGKVTPTDKNGSPISSTGLFTVSTGNMGTGGVYPNAITMVNDPIPAVLEKTDASGNKLSGATFTVKPKTAGDAFANGAAEIVLSDSNPDALYAQLIGGNAYTITETQAPAGFKRPDTSFTLTVDVYGNLSITAEDPSRLNGAAAEIDSANKALIRVKDQLTSLSFTKLGQISESCAAAPAATAPLPGVSFTVYSDPACTQMLAEAVSDASGVVRFQGLPLGTCYVRETAAPADYIPDDTVYTVDICSDRAAVLSLNGQPVADNALINRRYRADLSFTKQGELDDEPIPGAVYGLFRDGLPVAECSSDEQGRVAFAGLLTGVDYTLCELSAPAGCYRSADEIRFRYEPKDGQVSFKLLDNGGGVFNGADDAFIWAEPQIRLSILKTDFAGRPLPGAQLQLKDSQGNIVPVIDEDGNRAETWLSTKEPLEFSTQLRAGETYTLIELRAPAGYYLAKSIVFTLDETAASGQAHTVEITMKDLPVPPSIRTGDSSHLGLWLGCGGVSALLALALLLYLRRKKSSKTR